MQTTTTRNATTSTDSRATWHWPAEKVLETLAMKNALSAMRGKPCPVAARVVARLEASR